MRYTTFMVVLGVLGLILAGCCYTPSTEQAITPSGKIINGDYCDDKSPLPCEEYRDCYRICWTGEVAKGNFITDAKRYCNDFLEEFRTFCKGDIE